MLSAQFGITDYVILVASQVLCLGVGIYYGRKGFSKGTLEEFALGNRKIAIIPAAFSIFATCCSGHGMTAIVGEMYMYGLGYFVLNVFYGLGGIFVAFAVLPVFFNSPYISVYEYIERRYSKPLRIMYVVIYLIQQVLYMSVVMYVPAISLAVISHLPYWICLLTFSAVCITYSSMGGMKAVIWTDLLQSVLIFSCALTIIVKGTWDVGGPARVWEIGVEGGRIGSLRFVEDTANRYSFWAVAFGGLITGFCFLGTGQAGMQRALSVRGLKEAQWCMVVGSLMFIIFSVLSTTVAMVIYANFSTCDPTLVTEESGVKSEDQIVVYYISTTLSSYTGLAGLATAGIFSGSLSSLSSFINSFATITVHDIIVPNYPENLGRRAKLILCKCLTIFYGVLCTGFALAVPYVGRATPIITTAVGVLGGPLSGVFFIGMFVKKANAKGAFVGLIVSVVFGLWMAIGNKLSKYTTNKLPLSTEACPSNNFGIDFNSTVSEKKYVFPLYTISFAWYIPIGFIITVSIGIALSYIIGKMNTSSNEEVEEYLLSKYFHIGVRKNKPENHMERLKTIET